MFDTADDVTPKYRAISPIGMPYSSLHLCAMILRAFEESPALPQPPSLFSYRLHTQLEVGLLRRYN